MVLRVVGRTCLAIGPLRSAGMVVAIAEHLCTISAPMSYAPDVLEPRCLYVCVTPTERSRLHAWKWKAAPFLVKMAAVQVGTFAEK